MPFFIVTETCTYAVMAETLQEAQGKFLEAPSEFFSQVVERDIDGEEF